MSNGVKTFHFSPQIAQPKTEVAISNGLLESDFLPELCRESKRRVAIIADQAVMRVAEKLKKRLGAELFLFEGGEIAKTRETKQRLEDQLLEKRFGRDTLLVVIGGGVTTDLGGFLASTYMRGVPLVLIPTTLLAMVDAAIGGKTGIDTPFGKNLIGSFYFPSAIGIDTSLLKTLPESEWLNGLAEILKYGLIADADFWVFCETHAENWKSKVDELIGASIRIKMDVVGKDPEEKGMRRILNFGHTVGHAIEFLSQYQIPHGLAVAIGCQAESYLSSLLGYLSDKELERILEVYRAFGFAQNLPISNRKKFFEAMHLDKKAKGTEPRFVLLNKIGSCHPFDGAFCREATHHLNALAEFLGISAN